MATSSSAVYALADTLSARPAMSAFGDDVMAPRARSKKPFFSPRISLRDGSLRGGDATTPGPHHTISTVGAGQRPPRRIMREDEKDLRLLRQACAIAAHWPENYRVSVGIAAPDAPAADFILHLAETLEMTGLPPERLDLEFQEDNFNQNNDELIYTLSALRDLGVGSIMAGFGKGVSSLTLLRDRALTGLLNGLKLDRSLFYPSHNSVEIEQSFIHAVVGAGKRLGLHVRAEAVDTHEALKFLREIGCDEAQGMLMGGAESSDRFEARIRSAEGITLPYI